MPFDYAKPSGEKAAIVLLKFPSKYPIGHDKWRGPILYNPVCPFLILDCYTYRIELEGWARTLWCRAYSGKWANLFTNDWRRL